MLTGSAALACIKPFFFEHNPFVPSEKDRSAHFLTDFPETGVFVIVGRGSK